MSRPLQMSLSHLNTENNIYMMYMNVYIFILCNFKDLEGLHSMELQRWIHIEFGLSIKKNNTISTELKNMANWFKFSLTQFFKLLVIYFSVYMGWSICQSAKELIIIRPSAHLMDQNFKCWFWINLKSNQKLSHH